ncbi:HNH endonuclease [Halopseudomonas laoshanensis]|nr:HNH endonuclease [Halopseudomonas laoshanensis]
MSEFCYLCGKPMGDSRASGDHVVPVALIARNQPKARGFDYAGKLPTHEECNNRFGPETYMVNALELLEFLAGNNGHSTYQHRTRPEILIQAWDASKLPNFTERVLSFFKLIDVRESDAAAWSEPEFFRDKSRTNPTRDALHVALSVLTKSAAALLIKRKIHTVPPTWQVYAIPYSGATDALDFDHLLGDTKPFEAGVKVWLHQLDGGPDWLVLYRAKSVLVYLIFVFGHHNALATLKEHFPEADIHEFVGTAINDLLTVGWHKV